MKVKFISFFIPFILLIMGCPETKDVKNTNLTKPGIFIQNHQVTFIYKPDRKDITNVSIVGDFNGWKFPGYSLNQMDDLWVLSIELPYGIYQYKFLLNYTNLITNPFDDAYAPDGEGGRNSVLEVVQNH